MLTKNSKIVVDSSKSRLIKCDKCGHMNGMDSKICTKCESKLSKSRSKATYDK